jgi:hypothetical protein
MSRNNCSEQLRSKTAFATLALSHGQFLGQNGNWPGWRSAAFVPITRRPTKPTCGSQKRRIDSKVKRGQIKLQRGKVAE